ncbi:hypothetical protein UFOVP431_14 [uncultured Caudovirales phage]|uniref:Uncharacterized protein n=1 Tax=uncultured Caudovirales phage TaxID=2100421 RepID=A0A6J5MIZ8_9CAUD|nr:hypothetical protein UFOVP431_14 [uncultured Caudovirales phage]
MQASASSQQGWRYCVMQREHPLILDVCYIVKHWTVIDSDKAPGCNWYASSAVIRVYVSICVYDPAINHPKIPRYTGNEKHKLWLAFVVNPISNLVHKVLADKRWVIITQNVGQLYAAFNCNLRPLLVRTILKTLRYFVTGER